MRPKQRLKTIIGPGVKVKGEISGKEDLTVHGQVEGIIDFKKGQVIVSKTGNVNADVYGKIITIEGTVKGSLFGEEMIVLQPSGVVRGNMTAPRVKVEDGAKFKGNVDTESINTAQQSKRREVPLAKVQTL
ncbi:MAG: polymer-forming cytoskeletal protein, partial [Acidobacteria bacterium]|nr:polymer-forming cytoskeletal protein [Acidobacteriota bacterium]